MARKIPRVHYIDPASIDVGDTIRATSHAGDVETTHTGKVGKIIFEGPVRVVLSRQGIELTRWQPGVKHDTITLLDKAPAAEPALFDFNTFPETRERLA